MSPTTKVARKPTGPPATFPGMEPIRSMDDVYEKEYHNYISHNKKKKKTKKRHRDEEEEGNEDEEGKYSLSI